MTPRQHGITLGPAQETLLIPLYGRAKETAKRHAVLRDPQAVAMVDAIDYDFAKFGRGPSLLGSVLRGVVFDRWVRAFLAEHPGGTVVEIGAGLNTRYERLDNGHAQWVEFDLPDTMALRREFFADTPRRTMIDASAADEAWVSVVRDRPAPYFFVSEAVLIYLTGPDLRTALGLLRTHFPGSGLAMDTFSGLAVRNLHRHDALRTMRATLHWSCEDPREIDGWDVGLRWRESTRITAPDATVRRRLAPAMRLLLPVIDRLPMSGSYQLSRFDVVG